MSDVVIRVEGLSKRYRIGERQKYRTLREVLTDTFYAPFRRLSSFAKQASINGKERRTTTDGWIWALNEVSFNVKQGEVVGIIGRNGVGKSTLLKILSRITKPTKGYAEVHGRMGSLLEVGTGFHPELTGRENIYLNGAILGMKKAEIDRKFEEIVAFAETEKFLDTPVKRYSSGMYMRLAFAVAAHLETNILLVDEVLAVGDAQFQKKCIGKMHDLSRSEGRTVLFVSHNMDAIIRLCSNCLLLDGGQMIAQGKPSNIVTRYLDCHKSKPSPNKWIDLSSVSRLGTGIARFVAAQYSSLSEALSFQPYSNGPLEFLLVIESCSPQSIGSLAVSIRDQKGTLLVNADTDYVGQVIELREGENVVRLGIEKLYLNPGSYVVGFWLDRTGKSSGHEALDYVESAFAIDVIRSDGEKSWSEEAGPVICRFELLEVR